jgi:hypothetical protein
MCAARSLATHVGPPRARNATLAVALSGSICPSSTPATSRCWSSGQARAAHTRGIDGHRLARRQQHRCEALDMSHESSWDDVRIASYGPGRYIARRQKLPRHATMRSEAFQRPSHYCCPRKHYSLNHNTRGQVVYGRVHFSDELPPPSGSRPRTSPDPGRCGLS